MYRNFYILEDYLAHLKQFDCKTTAIDLIDHSHPISSIAPPKFDISPVTIWAVLSEMTGDNRIATCSIKLATTDSLMLKQETRDPDSEFIKSIHARFNQIKADVHAQGFTTESGNWTIEAPLPLQTV